MVAVTASEELAASFNGSLLGPGEAGYDDVRAVHNGLVDRHPGLIARCHNVAGRAVTEGGLMIDLSLMRGVAVDPLRRRATAQGGVTWNEYNWVTNVYVQAMIAAFEVAPSMMSGLMVEHFHGRVCRVDPTATAYPHRDPGYNLALIGRWLDPAETEANVSWVRETYSALQPYTAPRAYVNYLADDEDDKVHDAYGPNWTRLVEIKRQYDPDNLFRLNHNIDPAG